MRNESEKVVEKVKIHLLYSVTFSPGNRVVYEIMWKNAVTSEAQV